MISAIAMLTYSSVTKNAQMLRPNSTPSGAAARRSARLGIRRITAHTSSITAVAAHIRQKLSTTPPAPVALPSTPPNDQKTFAISTAVMPSTRPSTAGSFVGVVTPAPEVVGGFTTTSPATLPVGPVPLRHRPVHLRADSAGRRPGILSAWPHRGRRHVRRTRHHPCVASAGRRR